jgi:hypothetical protein
VLEESSLTAKSLLAQLAGSRPEQVLRANILTTGVYISEKKNHRFYLAQNMERGTRKKW